MLYNFYRNNNFTINKPPFEYYVVIFETLNKISL